MQTYLIILVLCTRLEKSFGFITGCIYYKIESGIHILKEQKVVSRQKQITSIKIARLVLSGL
jgi:hypothetical protein